MAHTPVAEKQPARGAADTSLAATIVGACRAAAGVVVGVVAGAGAERVVRRACEAARAVRELLQSLPRGQPSGSFPLPLCFAPDAAQRWESVAKAIRTCHLQSAFKSYVHTLEAANVAAAFFQGEHEDLPLLCLLWTTLIDPRFDASQRRAIHERLAAVGTPRVYQEVLQRYSETVPAAVRATLETALTLIQRAPNAVLSVKWFKVYWASCLCVVRDGATFDAAAVWHQYLQRVSAKAVCPPQDWLNALGSFVATGKCTVPHGTAELLLNQCRRAPAVDSLLGPHLVCLVGARVLRLKGFELAVFVCGELDRALQQRTDAAVPATGSLWRRWARASFHESLCEARRVCADAEMSPDYVAEVMGLRLVQAAVSASLWWRKGHAHGTDQLHSDLALLKHSLPSALDVAGTTVDEWIVTALASRASIPVISRWGLETPASTAIVCCTHSPSVATFKALAASIGWGDEASTTPAPVPSAVLRRLKALRRTLSDEAKLSALIECTRHPDGRPRYSFTHDQADAVAQLLDVRGEDIASVWATCMPGFEFLGSDGTSGCYTNCFGGAAKAAMAKRPGVTWAQVAQKLPVMRDTGTAGGSGRPCCVRGAQFTAEFEAVFGGGSAAPRGGAPTAPSADVATGATQGEGSSESAAAIAAAQADAMAQRSRADAATKRATKQSKRADQEAKRADMEAARAAREAARADAAANNVADLQARLAPGPTPATARLALVIGNAEYAPPVAPLPHAHADARAMAATLEALGFDVSDHNDLGSDALELCIAPFALKVRRNPGCLVVVYYSGHGVQESGRQLLVPTDGMHPLAVQDILYPLNRAASDESTVVVLLDCCRVELDDGTWKGPRGNRGGLRGPLWTAGAAEAELRDVRFSAGFLLGFACDPGTAALAGVAPPRRGEHDGDAGGRKVDEGGDHDTARGDVGCSPYTRALVPLLAARTPLLAALGEVQSAVQEATGRQQRPWFHSSLGRVASVLVL